MKIIALLVLALPASAEQHTLRPSSGSGEGVTVTVDRPSLPSTARLTVLPEGTTLTVSAAGDAEADVALIGPGGVESWEPKNGRWSRRLAEPGGYRLQIGRARGHLIPAQIDLVVTPEPATYPAPGLRQAEALFERREFSGEQVPTAVDQP